MSQAVLASPAPPQAAQAFGSALGAAQAYAALLAGAGVDRGLVGPRERDRLWERHLLNCAGVAELVSPAEVVVDLGSGAGLPGLVLALLRPDVTVRLVEPLLRRATFLQEAVAELQLGNVAVVRARAEDLPGSGADVVVARAVAPLGRLAGWAMPLLRPSGRLLALKGARAAQELRDSRPVLRRLGVDSAELVQVGTVEAGTLAAVVVVRAGAVAARPNRAAAGGRAGVR